MFSTRLVFAFFAFSSWIHEPHMHSTLASSRVNSLIVDIRDEQVICTYRNKVRCLIRSDFISLISNGSKTLAIFYEYGMDVQYVNVLDYTILRYRGQEYHLLWHSPSNTSTTSLRKFIMSRIQNIEKHSHLIFKRSRKVRKRLTHGETKQLVKISQLLAERVNNSHKLVQRFHWMIKGLLMSVGSSIWNGEAKRKAIVSSSTDGVNFTQGTCQDMRHNNLSSTQSGNCFGMCGMYCWCWPWVCGDCCLHKGCIQHDTCCQRNGYLSVYCLCPWVFGFDCQHGYNGYPDCISR